MKRLTLALAVFAASAQPAGAAGLDDLQDLAKKHLRPAPLVPTRAPGKLSNLGRTLTLDPARRKGAYDLRLVHYTSNGPDAVAALSGGDYTSMRAARHDLRDYKAKATHVRGHRGFQLTRNLGGVREWDLLWQEDGRVYLLGTGTARTVPLRSLRTIAAGLDHLDANYLGSFFAPGTSNTYFDATLVATEHFITGVVEFGTDNCTFNGQPAAAYGGSADFTMLPIHGNSFSVPVPQGWSGTITGSLAGGAISLQMQASGSFSGESCDTGPMSVTAVRKDPI